MGLLSFLSDFFGSDSRLSAAEFVERRRASDPVLDVRTAAEFARGHLKGAIHVDVMSSDFASRIEGLTKKGKLKTDQPVYLYCQSGGRSGRATRTLRGMGFDEAYNVGGFGGLASAGAEVRR